ncbi:MAG: cytochrome C precursor [Opitutia bacterium AMD-G1]|nr:MAG: cytochrome C precursor [Opitutae bacterium AMD-G1]
MKRFVSVLCMFAGVLGLFAAPAPLFDGKTLTGWEGDAKVWRVENGEIVGGSMAGNPRNEFLTTKRSFYNFRLTLEYKLVGTEGFVNGGVQFRSLRATNPPNEMIGYQADIGHGHTGSLYDESRRKKFLARAGTGVGAYGVKADTEIAELEKKGEWNKYEIRAEGPRITIFLNGKATLDYTETDPSIDDAYGLIGLQIHGNCKAEIRFRNITLDPMTEVPVVTKGDVFNRFGDPKSAWLPPAPFKDGKFTLRQDEVVVFIGQENLVREAKAGMIESRLAAAFAAKNPVFRSMAWEADTAHEQWRDLNFGPWKGQLEAAGATTLILQFGQAEALKGQGGLAKFKADYHKLLDDLSRHTPRIVLLSPVGFMPSGRPPDLTTAEHRKNLAEYASAVDDIAKQRGLPFVGLTAVTRNEPSTDGLHLSAKGLEVVGREVASVLGLPAKPEPSEILRAAIIEKNRLWADCWRPANWSFVYGDRISQNYGKGFGPVPSLKQNFEAYRPLVAAWDKHIQALARGEKSVEPAPQAGPNVGTEKVMTAAEEQATFKVAEGFEVNLFADESLGVAKPTQFSWDAKGRLYVCCSPTYPQAVPGVKPRDYILRLEDTDGDGKADKAVRFAEGLTMVQGVEPLTDDIGNTSILVCDFDRLIKLTDTDGDGKADKTEVLMSGFGVGDTHQLVNSISHGPDGTLWMSQGLHAITRVETPRGIVSLPKSGLMRYDLKNQRLQPFFQYGKAGHNCWGVAFDDFFQPFHKSGDRVAGYYSLPGLGAIETPDEYAGTHSLFESPLKSNSVEIVGTKAMPTELQGAAFIGGYYGNTLDLHRFVDDGSGFKTERIVSPIISSSKAFRPVDVSVGPDGGLYACDWFNAVIGHYQASYADPRRDRSHGRIWRITAKGLPSIKQPDLVSMSESDLFTQLGSPERWTRYQARRLLFNRPTDKVAAAADAFIAKDRSESQYLEAMGVMQSHGLVRTALLDRLQSSADFRIRAYAARVVGEWSSLLPDVQERLAKAIVDKHPRVRLEAVVALSHVGGQTSLRTALGAVEQPSDKFLDYALKQTVRHLTPTAGKLATELSAPQAAYFKKIASTGPSIVSPGQAIYEALCLNCHQASGQGLTGVYPPLAKSERVAGDPQSLIKLAIHGLAGPTKVLGKDYGLVPMPPMGLDDQQLADVLTYVRSAFGNSAPAVSSAEVKAVRDATKGRTAPWTAAELGK